jgi:hypothetical protein
MLLGEDYKKFESIAKDIGDYENTLVVLRSPGGEFGAADIGDLIHKSGMSTIVPENELCASICAFIWLGGAHRYAYDTSRIGFHGVYNRAGEVDHGAGMGDALIGVYLGHLGFSFAAAAWMISPPSYGMHWLHDKEAKEYGIVAERLPSTSPSPNANITASDRGVSPTIAERKTVKYTAVIPLNLRTSPGISPIILEIPQGAEVFGWADEKCEKLERPDRADQYNWWCPVSYNQQRGWANAFYLQTVMGARLVCSWSNGPCYGGQ